MDRNLTIFWKIVVETCNNKINIYKDVGVWNKISPSVLSAATIWHRIAWKRVPLEYQPQPTNQPNSISILEDPDSIDNACSINFNGNGYLLVTDPGLIDDFKGWPKETDIDLTRFDLESEFSTTEAYELYKSDYVSEIERFFSDYKAKNWGEFLGENIRIDATVDVDANANFDAPIFYYPQSDKGEGVVLTEISVNHNRTVDWRILSKSGTQHNYTSSPFHLTGVHQLTIKIDRDYAIDEIKKAITAAKEANAAAEDTRIKSRNIVTLFNNVNMFIRQFIGNIIDNSKHLRSSATTTKSKSSIAVNTIEQAGKIANTPRFEAMVDAVPLALTEEESENHETSYSFSLEETTFYIGGFPDNDTDNQKPKFQGKIKRIVFDPNISCTAC